MGAIDLFALGLAAVGLVVLGCVVWAAAFSRAGSGWPEDDAPRKPAADMTMGRRARASGL